MSNRDLLKFIGYMVSRSPYYFDDIELHGKHQRRARNAGKDGFQVSLDVQQFQPNELTLKIVDNIIVVEGKHEEREDDHGFVTRHFLRRIVLPKGYEANDAVSTLSSDGVLTVRVPVPTKPDAVEREIQIQLTGPAHLNVKENHQNGFGDVTKQNGDKSSDK